MEKKEIRKQIREIKKQYTLEDKKTKKAYKYIYDK